MRMFKDKKDKKDDPLERFKRNFEEAASYRKKFEPKLEEYEKFYKGEQWPAGQQRPVRNEIFKIIEGQVPILTDSMPGVDILPRDMEEAEAAEALQAHLNFVLEENNFSLLLPQAVRKGLIVGFSWFYVDYDPSFDNGLGLVNIKVLPWRQVYIDPTASTLEEANYAIIRIPMKVDEIKRMYPDKAEEIKASTMTMDSSGNVSSSVPESRHSWAVTSNTMDSEDKFNLEDMAFLEEMWCKDYSTVPIPEEETLELVEQRFQEIMGGDFPDIGKYENHELSIEVIGEQISDVIGQLLQVDPETVDPSMVDQVIAEGVEESAALEVLRDSIESHQVYIESNSKPVKPKYRNNWRLVIKTGKVLLHDDAPEVNDGMIPLAPVHCYKSEDSIYSDGEVKNIIEVQKTLNENRYSILRNLRLMGNGIWVVSANAGIDPSDITNAPGDVYTVAAGAEMRRESGTPVAPDLIRQVESDSKVMEDISGMNEAVQGVAPTANASGRMTRMLIQQAIGRIRLKGRMLENYTVVRIGKLISSRIVHYGVARKIRSKDENGKRIYIDYNPQAVKDLKYDVISVPGTTASIDKETIRAEALELLQGGQIEFQTYLKITNAPYKNTIIEAGTERDQLVAELEQLKMDNLKMKANMDPSALTAEERQALEEIIAQERSEELATI